MSTSELESRVINLEIAIQALWVIIQDTMPPNVQHDAHNMMHDLFDSSSKLGGYKSIYFKEE